MTLNKYINIQYSIRTLNNLIIVSKKPKIFNCSYIYNDRNWLIREKEYYARENIINRINAEYYQNIKETVFSR